MEATLDHRTRQCSGIKERVLSMINQLPDPEGFKEAHSHHGICILLTDDGPVVKLVSRGGKSVEIYDEDPAGIGYFQVTAANTPWKHSTGAPVTREEMRAASDRLPVIEAAYQRNYSAGLLRLESVVDLF
jgi:hypothetical protein